MSSRQAQRTRVPSTSDNHQQHPFQQGTLPSLHSSRRPKEPPSSTNPQGTNSGNKHSNSSNSYHFKCTGSIRGNPCPLRGHHDDEDDDGFTDEAFAEPTYYEYYDDDHGYQTSPNKCKDFSRADFAHHYSDEESASSSDSSSIAPSFEHQQQQQQHQQQNKRHSRHNFGGDVKPVVASANFMRQASTLDSRRVYPGAGPAQDARIPIEGFRSNDGAMNAQPVTLTAAKFNPNRRSHFSRMSSHSLGDSPTTTAVIYGCGGKCQTFENVCYYFLQVAFTMGILIGISLGIAGWVLRKSAARNLQVLLYIGALLSIVSALLLGIQCNARKSARMKRRVLINKNRAHIPMELLPNRSAPTTHRHPLVLSADNYGNRLGNQRGVPTALVQYPLVAPLPNPPQAALKNDSRDEVDVDQQGIPWWRRKDIN